MSEFFVHSFFIKPSVLDKITFVSENFQPDNRAFLFGDAVKVFFFVKNGEIKLAEETYFFLMASMRKMRMKIPLSYTLEFFQNLLQENVLDKGFGEGIITFLVSRNQGNSELEKEEVFYYIEANSKENIFGIQSEIEMDMIKEVNVNNNLLSNIHVHHPENTYGEIYAKENDLHDLILLNPDKRIARSIFGNLFFLQDKILRTPKSSEGAYISPLAENFITFLHRNNLVEVEPAKMSAFESQKSEEILVISDEKGIFSVSKIRNRTFQNTRFSELLQKWNESIK